MKRQLCWISILTTLLVTQLTTDSSALTPAYMSNPDSHASYDPTDADYQETDDTIITDEIRQKVAELNYDPVKIYEFVKNNIDYVPYYGSKLGATGTLYERRANSWDQASLLIAMYRAIGIPCRYMKGFIGIQEKDLMNWSGLESHEGTKTIFYRNNMGFDLRPITITDLSDIIEVDTQGAISLLLDDQPHKIEFNGFRSLRETGYLRFDKTNDPITNTMFRLKFRIDEFSAYATLSLWMISNRTGDLASCAGGDGASVCVQGDDDSSLSLYLINLSTMSGPIIPIEQGVEYDLVVEKTDDVVTVLLFSASGGTAFRQIECTSQPQNYMYVCTGFDYNDSVYSGDISGYISIPTRDEDYLIYHSWVEAYVPYGGLRGNKLADQGISETDDHLTQYSDNAEGMWIPLDPSYKKYENKFPVNLPDNMRVDALDFLNQYIYAPEEKMPYVLYEENLKSFLAGKYPEYSIDDLRFERSIVQEKLNILPATLPPEITVNAVNYEDSAIEEDDQWKLEINVVDNDSPETPATTDYLLKDESGNKMACTVALSTVYNKRITVSFDVDSTFDGDYYEKITNEYTTNATRAFLTPVVKIEGVPQNSTTQTDALPLVYQVYNTYYPHSVKIRMQYSTPLGVHPATQSVIPVGTYLAICLNYDHISPEVMESRYEQLKYLEEQIDNGTAGNCDEAPICEILYSLGAQYYKNSSDAEKIVADYMNCDVYTVRSHAFIKQLIVYDGSNWVGGPINLDVNCNSKDWWSRVNDQKQEQNFALLVGMTSSADEHKVFEDMFNIKAVSTMRILRMAQEADNNGVVYIDAEVFNEYDNDYASLKGGLGLSGFGDAEYTVSFLENNIKFDGDNADTLYIIPKRMTTQSEAGASTGTGYIAIIDNHGSAKYIITNSSGEKSNGGKSAVKSTQAPTPVYQSWTGYNTGSQASSNDFNVSYSNSNVTISTFEDTGFDIAKSITQFDVFSGNTDYLISSTVGGTTEHIGSIDFSDASMQWFSGVSDTVAASTTLTSDISIKLETYSVNGSTSPNAYYPATIVSDPIDTRSGEFYAENTDVEIPGNLPIIVKRNYSSQQETFDLMGYGWILNLNYFLWGNQKALDLADDDSGNDPAYKSVVLRLSEENGSVLEYSYLENDSTTITFYPNPANNPEMLNFSDAESQIVHNRIVYDTATNKFVYTSYNGTKKTFEYRQYTKGSDVIKERLYLLETKDIYGNYLQYDYHEDTGNNGYGQPKRIVNRSGSYVDFEYDVKGRVAKLTSSDRREVQYFYDELWNLVKVIDASGKTIKYEYALSEDGNTTHNLAKIIKPDNRILENVYDDEQVVEQSMTIGFNANPERTSRFVYGDTDNEGNCTTTVYTSIDKDEFGNYIENVTEYTYEDVYAKNSQCILTFDNELQNDAINTGVTCSSDYPNYSDDTFYFWSLSSRLYVANLSDVKTIEFSFKYSYTGTVPIYTQDGNTISIATSGTNQTITASWYNSTCTLISTQNDRVTDDWYHICITLDTRNQKMNLYVNGLLIDQCDCTQTNLVTGSTAAVFACVTSGCPGYMDNVGFYSITKAPGRKSPKRLLSVTQKGFVDDDSLNVTVNRAWDDNGNLSSITDANGNVTAYTYDTLDRTTSITLNSTETTTYTYVDNTDDILRNKVATMIDPNDTKTEYSYELTGNLKGVLLSKQIYTSDNDSYILSDNESYTYNNLGQLVTKTIASGTDDAVTYSYTYDRFGNVITIKNPMDEVTQFAYDEWGNTIRKTNPLGESFVYVYDNANNPIKITDPEGFSTEIEYDKNSNKIVTIDARGNESYYLYDYSDSLLGAMDPLGNTVVTDYDIFGNKLFVTNQNGALTSYEYDGLNRVSKEIRYVTDINDDPYQLVTSYTYDNNGNVLSKESFYQTGESSTTISRSTFTYNHRNQPITQKSYTDNDGYTKKEFLYDAIGNKTADILSIDADNDGQTDTRDTITKFTYSTEWNGAYLLKTAEFCKYVDGDNDTALRTTTYTYDNRGNKVSQTDTLGNTTLFEYDDADRLTATKIPLVADPQSDSDYSITRNVYDKAGRVVLQRDPNLKATTYTYDRNGRLTVTTDPLGRRSVVTYDAAGNTIVQQAPTGNTITYTYDALNRAVAVTDDLDNVSRVVYDGVGNKLQTIDAKGNTTNYLYDQLNRVIQTVDPEGGCVEYSFSYINNPGADNDGFALTTMTAKISDSMDRVTTQVTDWLGRTFLEIEDPASAGLTTSYTYDDYSRVVSKQTPNGNVLSYSYDDVGNLTDLSCAEDKTVNAQYTYDEMGRRLSMSDITGTTRYTYDAAGRLTHKFAPDQKSIAYHYDNAGNIVEKQFSGVNMPDDWADASIAAVTQTLEYNYNHASELETIYHNGTEVVSYSYNPGGLLESKTYTGVGSVSYTFDALDRLSTLTNQKSDESLISSQSYKYDTLGNKVQISTTRATTTFASAYRYDRKNQLVGEVYSVGATRHRNTYSYDGTGNRSGLTEWENDSGISTIYSVNQLNQVISQTKNTAVNLLSTLNMWGVYQGTGTISINGSSSTQLDNIFQLVNCPVVGETLTISSNEGDVITLDLDNESDVCYTYDNDGNLIYKSQNGNQTSYQWDALGRLTEVYYDVNGEINHVKYLYNADGQRIYEITNGSLTGNLYDNGILISEYDNNGVVVSQYIHGIGLGNDVGSLIYKQTASDTQIYYHNYRGDVISITDANGDLIASYRYDAFGNIIGSLNPELGFASKRYNSSTELSFFGARYYDASLGRFISRDPMKYVDGPNMYIYVSNNPLLFFDPFGLDDYVIVLPGTDFGKVMNGGDDVYMPDWAKGNSSFVKEVQNTFKVADTNVLTFQWSGENKISARTDAAQRLAQMQADIKKQDPSANFIVVTHSHGGNVALEATSYGAEYNTLVTLALPVRDDYIAKYNANNVGTHYNVYDKNDYVQKGLAGYTEKTSDRAYFLSNPVDNIPFTVISDASPQLHYEVGGAGQTFPGATNIQVNTGGNIFSSHSKVHDSETWRNQINSNINTSNSVSKTGRCP